MISDILDRRPVKYNRTYIEGNYCTQILPISIWINQRSYKCCFLHCLVNGSAQESVRNKVTCWDKIFGFRESTDNWEYYRNILGRDALSLWPNSKNHTANMGKNLGILTHQRISKELFWQTGLILRTSGFLQMKLIYSFFSLKE